MMNGQTDKLEVWRAERADRSATPAITLIKADQTALNAHWPFLREKLLKLQRKYERKAPDTELRWIPEQVRFEIMKGFNGQSGVELFLALGPGDEIQGFAITSCIMDPFRAVPLDFHIWLLSTWYPKVLEAAIEQLKQVARERGCTGIEHTSPFLSWSRRTAKMGFKIKYLVWRMELI